MGKHQGDCGCSLGSLEGILCGGMGVYQDYSGSGLEWLGFFLYRALGRNQEYLYYRCECNQHFFIDYVEYHQVCGRDHLECDFHLLYHYLEWNQDRGDHGGYGDQYLSYYSLEYY